MMTFAGVGGTGVIDPVKGTRQLVGDGRREIDCRQRLAVRDIH
jgi:hypothetical protein